MARLIHWLIRFLGLAWLGLACAKASHCRDAVSSAASSSSLFAFRSAATAALSSQSCGRPPHGHALGFAPPAGYVGRVTSHLRAQQLKDNVDHRIINPCLSIWGCLWVQWGFITFGGEHVAFQVGPSSKQQQPVGYLLELATRGQHIKGIEHLRRRDES